MSDNKPAARVDVTKDWQATQGQQSAARRLRIFAALAWIVAIGGEIAGIVLLRQHRFDHGNLPLLIGVLVGIAIFAIAGSLMWKAANKHDPARESDKARFFFQNQLGAIITLIAFLPLIVLIFMDKDMDPKNKKVAGVIGAVLAVAATLLGVSWHPPSVEQYTKDMNTCASQIKPASRQRPVHPRSPRRRRTSPGIPVWWLMRPRTPRTRTGRTWCTGSRRRTEPGPLRRRTSSTSAKA